MAFGTDTLALYDRLKVLHWRDFWQAEVERPDIIGRF